MFNITISLFFFIFTSFFMMETNRMRNLMIVGNPVVGNIPTIGVNGGIQDSGFKINDNASNLKTLWSSAKISKFVLDSIPKDPMVTSLLNDTAISSKTTWSSDQITTFVLELDDEKMEKQPSAQDNSVAVFFKGGVASSGLLVDDTMPSSATTLWTSKKFAEELDKKMDDEMLTVIDDVTASKTTVWSSEKTEATYLKRFKPADATAPLTLPFINRDGTLSDSSFEINNQAPAGDKILWTTSRILKSGVLLDYVANQTLTANQPTVPQVTDTFDDISQWNGQNFLMARRKARYIVTFRFFCVNSSLTGSPFVSVVFTKRNKDNSNIKTFQFSFPQTSLFMCHGNEVVDMSPNDELTNTVIATQTCVLEEGTCSYHEL